MRISIHVSLVGHGLAKSVSEQPNRHFNPCTHGGNDLGMCHKTLIVVPFQPTCPARGTIWRAAKRYKQRMDISILAPGGARHSRSVNCVASSIFQSVCPTSDTTGCQLGQNQSSPDFNPRAPHGARRTRLRASDRMQHISTHVPARSTTRRALPPNRQGVISIHVPRGGHDVVRGFLRHELVRI